MLGRLLERRPARLGEVLVHRQCHQREQDAEEQAERADHVGECAIPFRGVVDESAHDGRRPTTTPHVAATNPPTNNGSVIHKLVS